MLAATILNAPLAASLAATILNAPLAASLAATILNAALMWHGTSVLAVSVVGRRHFVALYDQPGYRGHILP